MEIPEQKGPPAPLWRRLLWFAGLWLGSVAVIAVVAYAIRLWLN